MPLAPGLTAEVQRVVTRELTAEVLGVTMPSRPNLARIGYMTQGDGIYPALTAEENVRFFAAAYGVEDGAASA